MAFNNKMEFLQHKSVSEFPFTPFYYLSAVAPPHQENDELYRNIKSSAVISIIEKFAKNVT